MVRFRVYWFGLLKLGNWVSCLMLGRADWYGRFFVGIVWWRLEDWDRNGVALVMMKLELELGW
jgi:hypothetical protein